MPRGVDPLASLRIEPIEVTIGDHEFVVEGHCAADWITLILGGTLHVVLPGWLDDRDDAAVLTTMLLDGVIDDEELNSVILDVFTVACGRTYWWAMNLISAAVADNQVWATLNGRLMMHGVRADKISLAAWIDAMYACVVDGFKDDDGRQNFDSYMETAPKNAILDEEEEGAAFMALLGVSLDES